MPAICRGMPGCRIDFQIPRGRFAGRRVRIRAVVHRVGMLPECAYRNRQFPLVSRQMSILGLCPNIPARSGLGGLEADWQ